MCFDGIEGEALVIALDLRGFAVSTGAACSSGAVAPSHVLTAIGLPPERARASMRFSLGRGNTAEQVDALVEALEGAVAHLPRNLRTCLRLPIAVAMSGGVDSSTVAALLVRQGHDVVGLTMQLWNQRRLPELFVEGATGRCCSLDDVYDARRVAEQIGIPYYVVNFERQFEEQVVKPFVEEYLAGRTPIPCTLCNNYIKFDRFLEMAEAVGARQIATGHYARIHCDEASGRYQLLRAVDDSKDQTYFLFGLTQEQLARTMFPLGETDQARSSRAGPLHEPGGGRQGRQPGDLLRAQRRLRRVSARLPGGDRRPQGANARRDRLDRWPYAGRT